MSTAFLSADVQLRNFAGLRPKEFKSLADTLVNLKWLSSQSKEPNTGGLQDVDWLHNVTRIESESIARVREFLVTLATPGALLVIGVDPRTPHRHYCCASTCTSDQSSGNNTDS
jgi:hypothetical protein